MNVLVNPETRGWLLVGHFCPWQVFLTNGPNKSHWCRFCVRLRDATASKRSWWLYWNHREQRLAKSPYANDLARRHPDALQQLMFRLRDWYPQR